MTDGEHVGRPGWRDRRRGEVDSRSPRDQAHRAARAVSGNDTVAARRLLGARIRLILLSHLVHAGASLCGRVRRRRMHGCHVCYRGLGQQRLHEQYNNQ